MKKVPLKKIVAFVVVGLLLFISNGYAQIEKGVTSTGKEVDCSTINPSVDKTVSEYGKIVTHPRVTRNGKLITTECSTCGVELSITDTVTCVSITLNAAITDGDPTAAVLKVYSDAAHNTQVGGDITATIAGTTITAVAANLNCYTRYYFVLEATEGTGTCTFEWTDSTRDMTMEKVTTCTVGSVRALTGGSDLSHEHLYAPGLIDSVYDHEGNAYGVVQIGSQCWLKENMRCTTSPTGKLTKGTSSSNTAPYYYCPTTNITSQKGTVYTPDQFQEKFGLLYNFPGTMDINTAATSFSYPHRGICPAGWHVPTDAELTNLADNAGVGTTESGTGLGKLAGGCDWIENNEKATCPGNYSYANRNESGFSALPAGRIDDGGFKYSDNVCDIWSATPAGSDKAWWRSFYASSTYAMRSDHTRGNGVSVRCVRDAQAKTYCSVDLKLDNENSSVDGRIDSVKDHEGNWYKVVQIGNQCWLAENMRATTLPSEPNQSILVTSGTSANQPRAYKYQNSDVFYERYGCLYNFPATMDYTGTLPTFTYPHRGICPEGWHVPEDAEWTTMERTVAPDATGLHNEMTQARLLDYADYQASNTDLAVRLSSGNDWDGNGYAGITPNSYDNSSRNSTGFSALPAGDYRNAFYDINQNAYFMSSTIWNYNSTPLVICRGLYYMYSGMNRNAYNLTNYYSVRCVRDAQAKNYCSVDLKLDNEDGSADGRIDSVADHEGNWYKVVEIGNICIMKQNLRVTSSPVGNQIQSWSGESNTQSFYTQNPNFGDEGYLYNWRAAIDATENVGTNDYVNKDFSNRRGLCPQGWHLPTRAEWTTIVGSKDAGQFAAPNGSYVGSNWNSRTGDNLPGNANDPDKNVTGFSGIPVGTRVNSFNNVTNRASFWSATSAAKGLAWQRRIVYDNNIFGEYNYYMNESLSVRCVRDNE